MKIEYISDVHLPNPAFMRMINNHKPASEFLIIAGDLIQYNQIMSNTNVFDTLNRMYRSVFWLPGNHEYYKGDLQRSKKQAENVLFGLGLERFFIANDNSITISKSNKRIKIIFNTLWTDFNKNDPLIHLEVSNCMNDYRFIKNDGQKLKSEDIYKIHKKACYYIEQEVNKKDADKIVVVTHHAPSFLSVPEIYKLDKCNNGYYSDLSDFILDNPIDFWIHGHIHIPCEYQIGRCTVVSNPFGYSNEFRFQYQHAFKTIEV